MTGPLRLILIWLFITFWNIDLGLILRKHITYHKLAQSRGAAEYTDYISAEE